MLTVVAAATWRLRARARELLLIRNLMDLAGLHGVH